MAPPKSKAAKAAPGEPVEMIVMVAKESVKYGGKRHMPDDPLLALTDDVDGLIAAGLADIAEVPEEAPVEEPK